jgi:hypothetical protein
MPKQIEVTRAAIVSRLRRRLARDGLILRMNRPRTHAYRKVGECAIIDPSRNALVKGGSVAEFAQRYELLASWEHII